MIHPKKIFYADVPDPLITVALIQVYSHSVGFFNTASRPVYYTEGGYNGRRLYICTKLDQALLPFVQDF